MLLDFFIHLLHPYATLAKVFRFTLGASDRASCSVATVVALHLVRCLVISEYHIAIWAVGHIATRLAFQYIGIASLVVEYHYLVLFIQYLFYLTEKLMTEITAYIFQILSFLVINDLHFGKCHFCISLSDEYIFELTDLAKIIRLYRWRSRAEDNGSIVEGGEVK